MAEELATWIERAKQGDLEAFSALVHRFQDMAVGYALSVLGDFHAAEDAPHGVEYDIMVTAFGPTSETIKAIDAARIEMISRAAEIGSNQVTSGSVARVRFDPIKEAEKEAAVDAADRALIASRGA